MDICRAYPKFEADQVLTAVQLNSLFEFLDLQSRWTRKCFIGAGIACGLQVEVDEVNQTVLITAGSGLTTLAYHLKLPAMLCTHYAEYTDPVQYPFFVRNNEQVPLWELLAVDTFDTEDQDNKRIQTSFLQDKVALLYLELKDVDLDTCTGSDCDEKGLERNLKIKILFVKRVDLDYLIHRSSAHEIKALYEMNLEKYMLPTLQIGRLESLGCKDNILELEDIQLAYGYILGSGILSEMGKAFHDTYHTYSPLLADEYHQNPFSNWSPRLSHPLGIQYFYDHIRDLILAYNEFVQYAHKVFVTCCIPDEGFPKHLMLGRFYEEEECKPSAYRHYFVTAMEPTGGEKSVMRVKSLFKRLVLLSQSFKLPGFSDARIKLTPSQEKGTPLSQRSIPYYYDLEKYPALQKVWNFELAEQCLSENVLNYAANECVPDCDSDKSSEYARISGGIRRIGRSREALEKFGADFSEGFPGMKSAGSLAMLESLVDRISRSKQRNQVRFPLEADICEFPFYRIEGHLGKDYSEAYSEIERWIKCYNLPIKLMGLKVGKNFRDVEIDSDCRFEDIELTYAAHRERIICYLEQTEQLIRSVKFDDAQDDFEESAVTRVTGMFVDGDSGAVLDSVYYAIKELKFVGRSDADGSLEISDLAAGNYVVETYLKGYGSKSFRIKVKQGKTLNLGTISLFKDAHFNEKEMFFREITAEEETRRDAHRFLITGPSSGTRRSRSADKARGAEGRRGEYYYAYEDLAGELAGKAGEMDTMTVTEKLNLMGRSSAAEAAEKSPYKIGAVYEDFKITNSRDILASARQYVYKNFATSNIRDTDEILDKIYQPLQIITSLNELIQELEKPLNQFDRTYFISKYQQLISQIGKYMDVVTGEQFGDLFMESDKDDIIRYFNLLRQENCFRQFQTLIDTYEARRAEIQLLQLLSVYACNCSGMSHVGGCWAGGTFFLIYDDSRKVVLDFALPYICCSDCPPVQISNVYPVVFRLPAEYFCKTDKKDYKFLTNFPGGEVIGKGVIKVDTEGEFYFRPSAEDVTEGEISFSYLVNGATYRYTAQVEDPQVSIVYNLLEVDINAETAEVQFTSHPKEATEYLWDFGDGVGKSDKESPVYVYDLSSDTTYTVTLRAKQGRCYAEAIHELSFEMCNANFEFHEVERTLSSISYKFRHPQEAIERSWDMGDGQIIENQDTFIHSYELGDSEREVTVELSMARDTCSDNKSRTFIIPARQEVTIFINRLSLCRDWDPEEVVFDPKDGIYTGNGLEPAGDQVFFHPAHPDVVLGDNEISYEYGGQKVSVTVSVTAITEEFSAEVMQIDGDEMSAAVQFRGPDDMDSYSYELGDGETRDEQSFLYHYDISGSTSFDVNVRLIKGPCDVIQRTTLDLTPCSAEFTFRVVANNGEIITIEYTALETGADNYQLEDELGVVNSTSGVIRRSYALSDNERDVGIRMSIQKGVCIDSFSTEVPIPAITPLEISIEKSLFVWCDDTPYPITVTSGEGLGKAEGPGVREGQNREFFFVPLLANTGGTVTITYSTPSGRSTSVTVTIKKPKAVLAIKSIDKISQGIYDVQLINNSNDFNSSKWVFTPGGTTDAEQPLFRLEDVRPNQQIKVSLTVAWDEACPSTVTKPFRIPADVVTPDPEPFDVDIRRYIDLLRELGTSPHFIKVFAVNSEEVQGTATVLETLRKDFNLPQRKRDYVAGRMNTQISNQFDPLIIAVEKRISSVASQSTPLSAQPGYPLFLLNAFLLVDLVGIMEKDLAVTNRVNKSLGLIVKHMKVLLDHEIDVNPSDGMRKHIKNALELNADKPNVIKSLGKIQDLLI